MRELRENGGRASNGNKAIVEIRASEVWETRLNKGRVGKAR